jgi:hypothetical protein
MTRRAVDFVDALSAEQRRRTIHGFDDATAWRDWRYVPRQRPGLPLKAMTEAQRDGIMRLIGEYVGTMAVDLAETLFARIRETGIGQLHFRLGRVAASGQAALPPDPRSRRRHRVRQFARRGESRPFGLARSAGRVRHRPAATPQRDGTPPLTNREAGPGPPTA